MTGRLFAGSAPSTTHLSYSGTMYAYSVSSDWAGFCDKRYAQPGSANNWQNALEQDGRSVRVAATYAL